MKFTVIALYIAIILSWLTAVIVDGNALRLGWLAVDIIFSPVGVVRGLLMWIGLAGYSMSIGHWVCLSPVIFLIAWGIYDCIKRKSL